MYIVGVMMEEVERGLASRPSGKPGVMSASSYFTKLAIDRRR